MQSIKPENPSKHNYFQLSREHNSKGLITHRYRNLLRYREKYEEIKKLGEFRENLIQLKGGKIGVE